MDTANLDKLGAPSRFELKNRSVELAASHAERVMLNARRKPNSAAPDRGAGPGLVEINAVPC